METTLRLAEAILNNWHDSYESGNSGRTYYTCHFCGGYGVPNMHEVEHDPDCPVTLAQKTMMEEA